MPLILTIDTSTEACSVALGHGGSVLEKFAVMPRMHARKLLSMIDELLGEAQLSPKQLDAIAFTRGPGSFTGLRISAAAVQGLAYGSDLPVIPISTLATLAQGGYRETACQTIMPVLDARMNELYWGHFKIKENLAVLQGTERLTSPVELANPESGDDRARLGIGQGWQLKELFPEKLRSDMFNVLPDFYPHAQDAMVLAVALFNKGQILHPEDAIPVYLRGTGAWKKQKNR